MVLQICDFAKSLNCSVPQFPYLENGDDNNSCFLGLLSGLNEQ